MKNFILKIILFLALLLIVNFIYLFTVQRLDWNFAKSIEAANFRNQSFRCIILGNSLAMDGIDAELLTDKGITAYNMALGGASLKVNLIQLQEYINVNQKTEFVILGLSSCIDTDLDSETVNPILDYCYGKSNYSIRDLPMWKYKWMGKELIKKLISKDHKNAYLKYGQLKFARIVPDNSNYRDTILPVFNYDKYERSVYLNRIDSLCTQHHIKLVVIEMPGIKKTQNDMSFDLITIQYADGGKLKFINLNNRQFCKLFDDQKDWLGNCHLNINGAQKLTGYIYDHVLAK
jgi:hypothetical protein